MIDSSTLQMTGKSDIGLYFEEMEWNPILKGWKNELRQVQEYKFLEQLEVCSQSWKNVCNSSKIIAKRNYTYLQTIFQLLIYNYYLMSTFIQRIKFRLNKKQMYLRQSYHVFHTAFPMVVVSTKLSQLTCRL